MKQATIYNLESLRQALGPKSRVLCLYSGGLDGTFLLHWLTSQRVERIVPLCINLGGDHNTKEIEKRARSLGLEPEVIDARETFAEHFVLPAIRARAAYLDGHPICASLSRPLMAEIAYNTALDPHHACDMILHTSNSSQNSLRRFNGALSALGFAGEFGSPFSESSITREEKESTLADRGVPLTTHSLYSTDTNLWGREFEYGSIDDPHRIDVPEFLYEWSRLRSEQGAGKVTVTFENGRPVALDDERCELIPLIARLNSMVGGCGIGRYIGLEEIASGVKVQEVREMPAAHLLFDAYHRIETATLSTETLREKMNQEQLWVREAVEGRWFFPLREAAQQFMVSLCRKVTGRVTYQLSSHLMQLTALEALEPLYVRSRDAFEHPKPTRVIEAPAIGPG